MKRESRKGKKYGRLTAIGPVGKKGTNTMWLCSCECGSEHVVAGGNLDSGSTKSCGCLLLEIYKSRITHGKSKTKLYYAWHAMNRRCDKRHATEYKNYSGRGISVCKEWSDFLTFYKWAIGNGYEEGLTLDRIDNDGNYSPENCRWTTMKVQGRNRRNNKWIVVDGKKYLEVEYAEKNGIKWDTFRTRLRRGWDIKTATTKPVQKRRS